MGNLSSTISVIDLKNLQLKVGIPEFGTGNVLYYFAF